LNESRATRRMGIAISVLLFIVAVTMERGVINASVGQALSVLLMLIGAAWAVRGTDKLRRLSELYLRRQNGSIPLALKHEAGPKVGGFPSFFLPH
jgi:hypothetical protein